MDKSQWKKYYITMAQRPMRPEKRKEMVERCGGLLEKETQEQAEERLIAEIKELKLMPSKEIAKLEARVETLEEQLITSKEIV